MTTEKKESQLVKHGPCSSCGSSDAVGVYDDGHGYCFSCDTFHADYDQNASTPKKATEELTTHGSLTNVAFSGLHKRKISEDTCRFWQYEVGEYNGRPVQIANYFTGEGDRLSKVRFPDKDFMILGKGKLPLYGSHLWQNASNNAKMVVVTEGEIDAMSVSQLMENRWPVVSVPNGAAGAVKAFKDNLEWLERYESVIIMFDNDKVGQEAADKCCQILSVGKAKTAHLPLKDANDMLVEGRGKELLQARDAHQPQPSEWVDLLKHVQQVRCIDCAGVDHVNWQRGEVEHAVRPQAQHANDGHA